MSCPRLPPGAPASACPAQTTAINPGAMERIITLDRSHAPALVIAARRRVDEGQGAHGEEARRVESEKRDGRVALMDVEEPGAPRTVEPERDLDEAPPEAPVHVGLAAPVSPGRTDAELRGAHEFEILPPQPVEHGQACAPRHPDADDHDGGEPPPPAEPALIQGLLGGDGQESGAEDAQRQDQA